MYLGKCTKFMYKMSSSGSIPWMHSTPKHHNDFVAGSLQGEGSSWVQELVIPAKLSLLDPLPILPLQPKDVDHGGKTIIDTPSTRQRPSSQCCIKNLE